MLQQVKDKLLGADVDAAGGLGNQKQLRALGKGTGDANLLLVAAGKAAGILCGRGAANIQFLDHLVRMLANGLLIGYLEGANLFDEGVFDLLCGKGYVHIDGAVEQQANALAVFGYKSQICLEGSLGVVEPKLLTLEQHLAVCGIQAHYAVGDAQLALACKAADANNFALANGEINTLYNFAGHINAKVLNLQHGLIADNPLGFVALQSKGTSNHKAGDLSGGKVLGVLGGYPFAVTKNGNAVGYVDDLIQSMADEHDTDALCCKAPDGCQQVFGLALGQYGGGLVKYQEADAGLVYFAGDLNELHVAYRQAVNHGVFFDIHAHGIQRLAGIRMHGIHIHGFQTLAEKLGGSAGPGDLTIELDVFGDGKTGNKHEFLMYHADALHHSIVRSHNVSILAVYFNGAFKAAGFMYNRHAEEDVHKGGLAGAVFAYEGMDLAGANIHIDALKDLIVTVELAHVYKTQN